MAKPKATKLQSFFEGRRRKASLTAWTHLRTKAGESRIKLDLRLPLLNEPVLGMGEAIGDAFNIMTKNDCKIERANLNIECEGMTMEMFSTDDSRSPSVSSTGVKMIKFALVASGEGEKKQLDLSMVAYIPAGIQVRDWAWVHLHSDFHLEAVYSQSEMEFGEEEADDEGPADDDEGDSSDSGNEVEDPDQDIPFDPPAAGKKSGPKELAAYHAAEMAKPN